AVKRSNAKRYEVGEEVRGERKNVGFLRAEKRRLAWTEEETDEKVGASVIKNVILPLLNISGKRFLLSPLNTSAWRKSYYHLERNGRRIMHDKQSTQRGARL
ncbi:hypothetical protein IRJ41_020931, partial [Triplophysa rosa]